MTMPFPVIDLFAGPGGLGEGFSAVVNARGQRTFNIGVSIEKDAAAFATLKLRSMFRHLEKKSTIDLYLEFMRGRLALESLLEDRHADEAARMADNEARLAELGKDDPKEIDSWIKLALGGRDDWVLIGGPPCQAYSLAGRSRRTNDGAFEEDEKHFLYREYLRILRKFRPAVFVMENVKGLLSSMHGGNPIFSRITDDLSRPQKDLDYELRSFVCLPGASGHLPAEFVIRSERYGVPQMRHRVIILGVRQDYSRQPHNVLEVIGRQATVGDILEDLPRIRSKLSKEPDSHDSWVVALAGTQQKLRGWRNNFRGQVEDAMRSAVSIAQGCGTIERTGGRGFGVSVSRELANWIGRTAPGSPCQHQSRGHMRSDIQRYFFAACYAKVTGRSPKLSEFPEDLMPSHRNARDKDVPFGDRFRVQILDRPASTIVSHISKDGHYYIHPDPSQCRSLTVREAARLQTFPDNYCFMGNQTQQYAQVGNAVPPFLAYKIGRIVNDILSG